MTNAVQIVRDLVIITAAVVFSNHLPAIVHSLTSIALSLSQIAEHLGR